MLVEMGLKSCEPGCLQRWLDVFVQPGQVVRILKLSCEEKLVGGEEKRRPFGEEEAVVIL